MAQVIDVTGKGNSRIAEDIDKVVNAPKSGFNLLTDVTVSDQAPCNMQEDGHTPQYEGWVEVERKQFSHKGVIEDSDNWPAIVYYWQSQGWDEVFIKVASKGGRSRIWVRK